MKKAGAPILERSLSIPPVFGSSSGSGGFGLLQCGFDTVLQLQLLLFQPVQLQVFIGRQIGFAGEVANLVVQGAVFAEQGIDFRVGFSKSFQFL